tara:strand:- start:2025 stop:2684 length:660 start_codon:yes stop_codon:yes gene_type:complete
VSQKKIAVVLAGCGHLDGSEITEAVSTLIALAQQGATVSVFAPHIPLQEVDHTTGKPTGHERDVYAESARICRGQIHDLKNLNEAEFDALVFPGGFGAALNLSDWAKKGSKGSVLKEVQDAILSFHKASKPIGAFCIAPTLVAKVLGSEGVTVTIGNDKETSQEIEKTGALCEDCAVNDFISDRAHKVVTSPAYMYDEATPAEVFEGISKAVKELVEMA